MVYGLDVPSLPGEGAYGQVTRPWHRVAVESVVGDAPVQTEVWVGDRVAVLQTAGDVLVRVERDADSFVVRTESRRPVGPDELLHPVMGFAGCVIAHWTSRWAFHAAAVVIDGKAWLMTAPAGGGKSTTASFMATQGLPVLCEDVAIVDQRTVLAGARICDLRHDDPSGATPTRRVFWSDVRGVRWRQQLPPVQAEVPLGGFVLLEWGATQVRSLDVAARLSVLDRARGLGLPPPTKDGFLDLLDAPFLRFRRPHDVSRLGDAVDELVRAVSD